MSNIKRQQSNGALRVIYLSDPGNASNDYSGRKRKMDDSGNPWPRKIA
jgi:hypothetical protein